MHTTDHVRGGNPSVFLVAFLAAILPRQRRLVNTSDPGATHAESGALGALGCAQREKRQTRNGFTCNLRTISPDKKPRELIISILKNGRVSCFFSIGL